MGAPRPVSLVERVVTTIAVPLVVFAAERIRLPYLVENEQVRQAHLDLPSILALGIMPFLTAYALVELAALMVPSWRRARHRPRVRARLERLSGAVALVLALAQGLGLAMSYEALDGEYGGYGWRSRIVVSATLAGGSCLLAVLARWATRRGLVNGYMLILAFLVAERLGRGDDTLIAHGTWATFVSIGATVASTWIAIATTRMRGTSPTPNVPVPASSIVPVPVAVWLVAVPAKLTSWHLSTAPLVAAVAEHHEIALVAVALGLTIALAALLQRPDEVAESLRQLGVAVDAQQTAGALWRAMLPTLAFVALLTAGTALVSFAIVAAVLYDLSTSLGAHLAARGLVVVREERRAYLVAPIRAALAAEGIDAWARGSGVLALLQAFGPYAPAEILVRAPDAQRAVAKLAALDAEELPNVPAPQPQPQPQAGSTGWGSALARAGAIFALLGFSLLVARLTQRPKLHYAGPRAQIAIVRVDDLAEPLDPSEGDPPVQGAELRTVQQPAGTDAYGRKTSGNTTFVRVVSAPGEKLESTWARVLPWLETRRLPARDRWSWEAVLEPDSPDAEGGSWHAVGVSSIVLTGDDIVTTADVIDASVGQSEGIGPYTVTATLRADAARRFEDATREWIGRRIAILVDGHVDSAPVVRTAIGGGRFTITMGAGEPEKQLADATRLAASLGAE
jgi:preprotein translocase subunit SecY